MIKEKGNLQMSEYQSTLEFLSAKNLHKSQTGLILGSGLGILADSFENPVSVPYSAIPGFPVSTVEGHKGQLVSGILDGIPVLAMQGRFHFYEGYTMSDIIFPVRVMKLLGIDTLIVTNAAGGVNKSFSPGDLMIITDHIKLVADSPLRGKNDDRFGPRFNDMSRPYSPILTAKAEKAALELGLSVQKGTYMFMSGPSYETPAEIRAARILGADAVGMSTVPEVIAASHCGMKVLGISCITNMASGILDKPLNHEEVIATAARVHDDFIALLKKTIIKIS